MRQFAPLVCLAGCSLTQQQFEESRWDSTTKGPLPEVVSSTLDSLDASTVQDSGVYYAFLARDYKYQTPHPASKVRRLYAMGFPIARAWYRPPIGGCQHPGSAGFTKTMAGEWFCSRCGKSMTPWRICPSCQLPNRGSFRAHTSSRCTSLRTLSALHRITGRLS